MKREDQGDVRLHQYRLVARTLCFVFHSEDVLLLRGAPTKRLWANLYNGIGGHVERGEDVASAARREIREETGLEVDRLRLRGVVTIDVEPSWGIGLYVFTADAKGRELAPSPDGELGWFSPADLPASDVVEDLPTLLHKVISAAPSDPPFCAHYRFDSDNRLTAHFSA
jgi:8-oxo-dGTP diphosphatase